VSITVVYDATHDNIGSLPRGAQVAGYTTGTGTHIRWTAADWAAHPGAVRIDQDPAATDHTADILDVESGAATLSDVVPWFKAALANYRNAARPGQRWPAIYASQSAITSVANALVAGGVTEAGPGLWVANWNLSQAAAVAEVLAASGPYPIVGVQFRDPGPYDVSVFSADWLNAVSGPPSPPPPPPPSPAVDWSKVFPTLSQNSSGPDVRTMQGCLVARGAPVTVDGAFGPRTAAAVRSFQSGSRLAVDGVVGPKTWAALLAR
jgi:lysozyme family protein